MRSLDFVEMNVKTRDGIELMGAVDGVNEDEVAQQN